MGESDAMTREEREALIDRLQASSAEMLADIAERKARAAPDEVLHRSAPELIFKRKDDALIEEPPPAFTEAQMAVLESLADEAGAACGKLEARIVELEHQLDELRGERGAPFLELKGGDRAAH
jgi:hypothetical protein